MLYNEVPDRMVCSAFMASSMISVGCGSAMDSRIWNLWKCGQGLYTTVGLSGVSERGSSKISSFSACPAAQKLGGDC